MKIAKNLLLLLAFGCFNLAGYSQTFSDHRSVKAYAEINASEPSITLKWEIYANATAFKIYKRELGSNNWGSEIANLPASSTEYKDVSISQGKVYEYSIEKVTSLSEPFANPGNYLSGYSYLSASILKEPVHTRGKLWILIAKNINDSLSDEITVLLSDLAGDGWDANTEVINPSATVTDVKSFIDTKKAGLGCDAVYLLGNIPVPYSGTYCQDPQYLYPPDGHDKADANSHCGAWPADVYYGTINGAWTDTDSTSLAKRAENNNAIGDGKFDNNKIPGDVSIAIGRVDLSRLSIFTESEVELTRRYLNKAHEFKSGGIIPMNKGIVENNFSAFQEGFSSSAIRDFTAHFGENGVVNADVFTSTANDDYLMSYTCGAGWYTSCNGVGKTADYTSKNGAMFNHIFGSFFGDFDIENNFMRASLASQKMGLICIWSGRPKWVTHTLALGENYGDCALRTQNNWLDYDANFYQKGAHLALLGDPSLRTNMLLPASNVNLTTTADSNRVDVTWTASNASDINGYYLYRSHKPYGGYVLLNSAPITATTLTDNEPYDGTNFYMVRTAKITTTGSGSYENLSIGTTAEINGLKGSYASVLAPSANNLKVYPTLTNDFIYLENTNPINAKYTLINSLGEQVLIGQSVGSLTAINVQDFSKGIYYILTGNQTHKFVKY